MRTLLINIARSLLLSTAVLILTSSSCSAKIWEKQAADWSAKAEEAAKEELSKMEKKSTADKIATGLNTLNDNFGEYIGEYLGENGTSLLGEAGTAANLYANGELEKMMYQTGASFLPDSMKDYFTLCYEKTSLNAGGNSIDICAMIMSFDTDKNICDAPLLPEIPGHVKLTSKYRSSKGFKGKDPTALNTIKLNGTDLESAEDEAKEYCREWLGDGKNDETTVKSKITTRDATVSTMNAKKAYTNTNVKSEVLQKDTIEVKSLSLIEVQKEGPDGKKITIQPFKGIEDQSKQKNRDAHKFLKSIAIQSALEGDSETEIKRTLKSAALNAKYINVAYKNALEYSMARNELIGTYQRTMDNINNIMKYEIMFQDDCNTINEDIDISKPFTRRSKKLKILASKVASYMEMVDRMIAHETAYYDVHIKKGYVAPTKSLVDSVVKQNLNKEGTSEAIERAALVTQIDRQINQEAKYIATLKANKWKYQDRFERRLKKILITSQQFDVAKARKSVGLDDTPGLDSISGF